MTLLSRKSIYRGRVIELDLERVELPNGRLAELEIIRHPGGAAVAAIDEQRRICLIRQFRHAANGWIWELPAGKIDRQEPPLETARRELEEEAGVRARHWQSLGDYVSSPGVFTEVVHLFMASGLEPVPVRHEEHEVLEIHWVELDRVLDMARSGELRDGKSLVAVFRCADRC
jgi:8-oxo-dGTP pyrophosphatase MutT (NUDIX family)